MDEPDSENELNVDFGIVEYDGNSNNDKDDHIPREKVRLIKKTKKKKSYLPTVKKESPKETHTRKINEEDNDEKMDTSYNKGEDEYEGMTLNSKPSTPDLPNTGQVIDSNDEKETT